MSRTGLNRTSALATTTLVLAAEAADIDVLAAFGGRVEGFAHHRGITHSFVGVPLVAALVVLVLYLWFRWLGRRRWKPGQPLPKWRVLFLLACLAGLTHILLDYTNNYGVRPFEPFSYRWYSWDIVFIVEPVLWVLLVAGLLLPSLLGLISDEVKSSSRVKAPRGRAGAIVALALVVAFWGLRDYQHRRAVAAMQAFTYYGSTPLRVSAFPFFGNPFHWYGVVETETFYVTTTVDSSVPEVDPEGRSRIRYKPEQSAVLEAAKQSHVGRVYLDWSQYPMTEVERLTSPAQGYLVRFYDLRFAPEFTGRPVLGAWVELDSNLRVISQNFGPHPSAGAARAQR